MERYFFRERKKNGWERERELAESAFNLMIIIIIIVIKRRGESLDLFIFLGFFFKLLFRKKKLGIPVHSRTSEKNW